jgi:hypothetical protein
MSITGKRKTPLMAPWLICQFFEEFRRNFSSADKPFLFTEYFPIGISFGKIPVGREAGDYQLDLDSLPQVEETNTPQLMDVDRE